MSAKQPEKTERSSGRTRAGMREYEPTLFERLLPWRLRLFWIALVPTLGRALGDALSDRSRAVQIVATIVAWLVWAVGLLATLVPHPIGLVALRTSAVALVAAALVALLDTDVSSFSRAFAANAALVAIGIAMSAETGHWCVNGPAYPNERRYLLRPGVVVGLFAAPFTAVVVAGLLLSAPLLLAARAWVPGVLAAVGAVAATYVGGRALYAVARRFVVFVPAGFVLHDDAALHDPVLFRSATVDSISAALAGTDALDLTMGAPGLAVEVRLKEKVEITRRERGNAAGRTGSTARFLIVPTRPGRLITDAGSRRYATTADVARNE